MGGIQKVHLTWYPANLFMILVCCAAGAVLDLPKLLPGSFKSGQLVCPEARKVCPTLGCAGGCANGYCWQVS